MLITVGIVFLLRNLGNLQGDAWDTILRLWPLILVAIGLDGIWQRHGLAGPTFMIGLGIVFLLDSFGLLAWDVWDLLLRLWPVLVVAIGLDMVLGRRNAWGAVLAVLLTLALLAGAAWYIGSDVALGRVEPQIVRQAPQNAAQATLLLEPTIGALHLAALEDATQLVDGTVQRWRGETVVQEYTVSQAGQGMFRLSSRGINFLTPSGGQRWSWDLMVSPDLPLDIQVKMASGEARLDLSGLQISSLQVDMAIGRLTVFLPVEGDFSANLSGAIGDMAIVAPEGLALRIRSETGLGNLRLPEDYRQEGDFYLSPAYAEGEPHVVLVINQAIGMATVLVP
jgi:hypothetical protein